MFRTFIFLLLLVSAGVAEAQICEIQCNDLWSVTYEKDGRFYQKKKVHCEFVPVGGNQGPCEEEPYEFYYYEQWNELEDGTRYDVECQIYPTNWGYFGCGAPKTTPTESKDPETVWKETTGFNDTWSAVKSLYRD